MWGGTGVPPVSIRAILALAATAGTGVERMGKMPMPPFWGARPPMGAQPRTSAATMSPTCVVEKPIFPAFWLFILGVTA